MNPLFINTLVLWERNLQWQEETRHVRPLLNTLINPQPALLESDFSVETDAVPQSKQQDRPCETQPC